MSALSLKYTFYLACIAFTLFFITSCSVTKEEFVIHQPTIHRPFVTTIDGIADSNTEIKITGGYKNDGTYESKKFVTDKATYKIDQVYYYGDGKDIYCNLGAEQFATKISEGNIDIYQLLIKGDDGNRYNYYLKTKDTNRVVALNYRNLKKIINSDNILTKLFQENENANNVAVGATVGAGCLAIAFYEINSKFNGDPDLKTITSVAVLGIVLDVSFYVGRRNRYNCMVRAINAANNTGK